MAQLHFYVPDEVEVQLRRKAQQAHLSLSRYLADLVKRETAPKNQWPEGYFDQVFGQWQGEALVRPPQGDMENRLEFK